jgi:hypothetical protein
LFFIYNSVYICTTYIKIMFFLTIASLVDYFHIFIIFLPFPFSYNFLPLFVFLSLPYIYFLLCYSISLASFFFYFPFVSSFCVIFLFFLVSSLVSAVSAISLAPSHSAQMTSSLISQPHVAITGGSRICRTCKITAAG